MPGPVTTWSYGSRLDTSSKHEMKFFRATGDSLARWRASTSTPLQRKPFPRSKKVKSARQNLEKVRRSWREIEASYGLVRAAGITTARWCVPTFFTRSLVRVIARSATSAVRFASVASSALARISRACMRANLTGADATSSNGDLQTGSTIWCE